jgi:Flp pilus assembly protein TadG
MILRWSTVARCRRIAKAEDGAAAVEMAVSITALLMVIVGMMKMCLAIYCYHYTSEAAREGARWAIVRGSSSGNETTADGISTYVKALGYPALLPANMTVTVTWAGFPTGVACTPNTNPCDNPGNMVTVTVQYAFPLSIPFRSTRTLNMSSTSSAIIAQ